MLVDDSAVVRGLISRALTAAPDIEIVATAFNGAIALKLAKEHQPDIILLDVEMPEMDGITALPKLLEVSPDTKIVMVSTLTMRNAEISIRALSLGATDYITKPTTRTPDALEVFYRDLRDKIYALAAPRKRSAERVVTPAPVPVPVRDPGIAKKTMANITALAIASSTGGPQALVKLFSGLKNSLTHIPIFLTQHMPATFTTILAQHLAQAGGRPCKEGEHGEQVKSGHTYVAPGNYHMTAVQDGTRVIIHLDQGPSVNSCRPSADPMFESLSRVYGKHLLATVLTGMGQDGLEGARAVVNAGGNVIAQDEATCVVWGMPKMVTVNNLCRAVLPLPDIAGYLIQHIR